MSPEQTALRDAIADEFHRANCIEPFRTGKPCTAPLDAMHGSQWLANADIAMRAIRNYAADRMLREVAE